MAPIIEVSNETLETLNPEVYTLRNDLEAKSSDGDFIYVPSIKLYVAKEKTLLGTDWNECQEELHSKNQRMLTISEFREFLKYTKENHQDIYQKIIKIKSPWKAEWLDADFKVQRKDLYVNYHIFDINGKIIKKSEKLDKNTQIKDKKISLDNWLNNSTNQGLPQKSAKSGNLNYWVPMKDNNSVTRFGVVGVETSLYCKKDSLDANSNLGVRAVKFAA